MSASWTCPNFSSVCWTTMRQLIRSESSPRFRMWSRNNMLQGTSQHSYRYGRITSGVSPETTLDFPITFGSRLIFGGLWFWMRRRLIHILYDRNLWSLRNSIITAIPASCFAILGLGNHPVRSWKICHATSDFMWPMTILPIEHTTFIPLSTAKLEIKEYGQLSSKIAQIIGMLAAWL